MADTAELVTFHINVAQGLLGGAQSKDCASPTALPLLPNVRTPACLSGAQAEMGRLETVGIEPQNSLELTCTGSGSPQVQASPLRTT